MLRRLHGGTAAKRLGRPGRRRGLLPMLVLGLLCGGCDSESFVPSRPVELTRPAATSSATPGSALAGPTASTSRSASTPVGARAIELIAAPRGENEAELMKSHARTQAGIEKVRLQAAVTGEKATPGPQSELVRKAIARNPLALVVEPADPADADLARALNDARDRGTVVVVVGRPLVAKEPQQGKSPGTHPPSRGIIQVMPEPFTNSAHELVTAAVNNARNAKLALDGGAILFIDTACDPLVEDRVSALAAALKDAGVRVAHEVRYAGVGADGEKKLGEVLKADTKACVVLGADNTSTKTAYNMTDKWGKGRPFIVAGYTTDESDIAMIQMGEYAGIAAFSADRLIRKAVNTASAAAAGQKVPEKAEMRIPVHTSPSEAGVPRMKEAVRAKMKAALE